MNKSLLFAFVAILIVILVVVFMQQQQINQLKSSLSYADMEQLKVEKPEREPIGFKIPIKKSEEDKKKELN